MVDYMNYTNFNGYNAMIEDFRKYNYIKEKHKR